MVSKIVDNFLKNINDENQTELCVLLKKYGSDKCSDWHNYSKLYYDLFKELKNESINFFEVGIYQGASVRTWRDFFPKANIWAGDVDHTKFVNEDRIKSFYCNQDDPKSIMNMWENEELKTIQFDVIVDDGKHEYISNINFLNESIHKLKNNGLFIIEDLTWNTYSLFERQLNDIKIKLNLQQVNLVKIPNKNNKTDNNLLIIIK